VNLVFFRFEPKKSKWVEAASDEFLEKIGHFHKVAQIGVTEDRNNSTFFEKFLSKRDFLIAFDENGIDFTSKSFSIQIERIKNQSAQRICFVIGPAYGLHEEIKKRANLNLKLSNMTLNHQLAYLVALEQVYRALTISANHPYHHE
jgi:23S rRNA (pseudouridine1915-N3)-methyltransferase